MRLFGSLMLLFSAASATAVDVRTYAVSAALSHQGAVFGEPSFVVRDGEPATVEVSGEAGYKLSLTVRSLAEHKLQVVADLRSRYGAMSPTFVVVAGAPAFVEVGDIKLTVTAKPYGG